MKLFSVTIFGALVGISASAYGQSDCVGSGDINADGFVKLSDHTIFFDCFAGSPGACTAEHSDRSDLNGDGMIDLQDAAAFFNTMGDTYLAYGPHRDNLEAEMLAMALTGRLRAPDTQYNRIELDLSLIRTTYPELTSVVDDWDYAPGQLLVGINTGVPTTDYEALNEYFLLESEDIQSWGRILTFCDNLNAPVVAADYYNELAEVAWADPNWFIGTDDAITVSTLAGNTYRYNIDDGFWDCFDGCDCHRVWVIDVSAAGVVSLVSYNEFGQSWCDFGE